LTPLHELKNLKALSLPASQINTEMIEDLQAALPNCNIYY